MSAVPDISLVIPVFNEEESVADLVRSTAGALDEHGLAFELLLVDDGSEDGTFQRLCDLQQQEPRLRIIQLRRNFGQTAALSAGFDRAEGEVVVTMDGDLQNDPRDIPALLTKLDEGYDLVSGWRKDRQDPFWSRRLPSALANWLISRVTQVPIRDLGCSLKAYRHEILRDIDLYGEMHRFLPILARWVGARITEIPVRHHPRTRGRSKYGIGRTFRVILDLLTVKFLLSYSTRPIQIFGGWGLGMIGFGLAGGVATVIMRLLELRTMTRNPLLLLSAVSVIVGVQLIVMGLLGEINIRTYYESQRKPIYLIRQIREREDPPESPPG